MTAGAGGETVLTLHTRDGVRLAGTHLEPRAGAPAGLAVVLAHGFSGHHRKPAQWALAQSLRSYAGVVALDLRGHGRSGGLSTLGDREVLDVEAGVRAARDLGYADVATVGFSMGGSSVLRHAALVGGVDAVVSVSATSRWFVRDTVPMRRLHWLVERRLGRRISRHLMGTRIVPAWDEEPESPVDVVGRIAPTPLLLVHGDRDSYFTVEHPHALRDAANEPVELWLVEGFGHAESAVTPQLMARIGAHLPVLLARRAATAGRQQVAVTHVAAGERAELPAGQRA